MAAITSSPAWAPKSSTSPDTQVTPIRVIAMRNRRAKQGHDIVPDMFVDGAAEFEHKAVHHIKEPLKQTVRILGVQCRAQGREAGKVDEHYCDRTERRSWY